MKTYQEKVGPIGLHIIETEKYKSIKIVFKFRSPLKKETLTKRSLIAMLLETNNATYKTQTDFRKRLAYLYGSNFYTNVEKKGNEHIVSAAFDLVDGQYVPDGETLLEEAFTFLESVFHKPNVTSGAFDEETLFREKENLKARLISVFDDKMRYATKRLLAEMFKGDVFQYDAAGNLEDIDRISGKDLYNYYQEMLASDQLDLFICGNVTPSQVIPLVKKLNFAKRNHRAIQFDMKEAPKQPNVIFEQQPIHQGKLVMGYQTGVLFGDDCYVALQLANGLLGGFPHSKIFINVREKAGLAYYAASRLDTFKGYLLIFAGIDEKNYEQAVNIIKKQIVAMKQGDFTEKELTQTKEMYINQLLEMNDEARGIISLSYNNILTGANLTLERWLDTIKNTTKQQVIQAIKAVQEDTTYFLSKGAEQDEKNDI